MQDKRSKHVAVRWHGPSASKVQVGGGRARSVAWPRMLHNTGEHKAVFDITRAKTEVVSGNGKEPDAMHELPIGTSRWQTEPYKCCLEGAWTALHQSCLEIFHPRCICPTFVQCTDSRCSLFQSDYPRGCLVCTFDDASSTRRRASVSLSVHP